MISLYLVLPFAAAYARHGGYGVQGRALEEALGPRLRALPAWSRAHAAAAALFARWLAPALLLGRLRRFERLDEPGRERLLAKLQYSAAPLRAFYFGVKAPLLAACARAQP